ncbi:LacI family DNA-binding transcriptional regulator [Paenibacillus sp. YN15]|uniref:LacI family DNA-binding transcriptional regulator n=1 Tax=Paenibacillus sp. YN15 TaxID=1742774 RepID=UPI000DCC4D02|nr:LacI family DNA-binding transcriptional regulator [Paenibacillus sp. YN15]RAV04735.1 LacI family transcriptional regulator [Paenibacillus sp. YN15]
MPTIHDVALRAGVSVTTVSRVINNRGYLSEETRRKVFAAMDELHYQPNEIARSLLKKQSNLIGLIIPTVSNPFFGQMAASIEACAYENGMKLLLCNSLMDPAKEKEYIGMMRKNRVDGIIMGSHTLEVDEYLNLNHPLVTFDRKIGGDVPYIASDNYAGGQTAAQLLLDKGCRKIAHICGNLALNMLSNRRTDGFLDTVKQHSAEHVMAELDINVFDYPQYEKRIRALFREHPDIDGVFATSDIIASFVVKIAQSLGLSVPDRLKVVGYDDILMASWFSPSLSTIRQPIEEMGNLAVDLIRRLMAGESIQRDNLFPVELIERESTG